MSDGHSAITFRKKIETGIDGLTANQLRMVAGVVGALKIPIEFSGEHGSDLVDGRFAEIMANFLVLHHALHEESLNKKPFEYVFKQCLIAQSREAWLNPTPGEFSYDISDGSCRWSLKTEAAKGISPRQVKIEKLMEARWIRECPSPEECAAEVRKRLPHHMDGYDRILVLRAFARPDSTIYRLEEVPAGVLRQCFSDARPEMFTKNTARKSPSFGANFLVDGRKVFRILLDSSVEKVRLWYQTEHCIHHGSWIIPRFDEGPMQLYTRAS